MARGLTDTVDPFDLGDGASATPPIAPATAPSGGGKPAPSDRDRVIGERIRLRRDLLQMSQQALGRALGVSFQQVQKYERGTNRVSATRLQDIARALDVALDFFQVGEAEGERPTGFAESQAAFGLAPSGLSGDVMARPETITLVGSYWRIVDPGQRRRVLELIKSMAAD